MKRHVLDTDTLTLYQGGHPAVVQHVVAHPLEHLAVTVISVEEQLTGWYTQLRQVKGRDQLARVYQRLAEGVQFLAQFQVLSFTEPAILRYEYLKGLKLNVGKYDLRIAAIVLEHGDILVTRNTRDFQRVPNLVLEDWTV